VKSGKETRGAGWRVAAALLVAPAGPALLTGWLHPLRPDFAATKEAGGDARTLGLEAIRARHAEALWVDARPTREYAAGHVPGAKRLADDEWEAGFAGLVEAWDGRRAIVVYCGGAECRASEAVARRLRVELGHEDVYVLRGGWDAWRAAGGEAAR
jgi:rhodanese-related sulfurtransferase